MRFLAQSVPERGGGRIVRLHDTERRARVAFHPSCGGTVTDITLATDSDSVPVLCPNPDGKILRESISNGEECFNELFPGRLLWPFSDRIPRGVYRFEGQEYRVPVNDRVSGDAIHGFLYARSVSVEELGGSNERAYAVARAHITPGDHDGYPFEVELRIVYQLDKSGFELNVRGRNLGGRPAPMSMGWHPYFSFPGLLNADELELETNADRYVPVDIRLLPTGSIDPVTDGAYDFRKEKAEAERRIGDRHLDIALTNRDGGAITTTVSSKRFALTISQSGTFAYQQLFIPPSRNSIAIEPLTSATNAFNQPDLGLLLLNHNEEFEASCRITLSDR